MALNTADARTLQLAVVLRCSTQLADGHCVALQHADSKWPWVCAAQEMEMGTSSVARDAAYSYLARSRLEQGNTNAQWWAAELLEALGGPGQWFR